MAKNKFSDTDLFWNQFSEKDAPTQPATPQKNEKSAPKERTFSLSGKEQANSITIDRHDLLKAVEQLSQMQAKEGESPVKAAEKKAALPNKTASAGQKSALSFSPREKTGESGTKPMPEKKTETVALKATEEKKPAEQKEKKALTAQKERKEKKERKEEKERVAAAPFTVSKGMIAAIAAAFVVGIGSFLGLHHKLNADKAEMMAYLEAQLTEIRNTNDAAIAQMHDTLDGMKSNFGEITDLLEETGASIGSSSKESREAINQRIEKLDKQLQSLQKSLAVIQEDANGRK